MHFAVKMKQKFDFTESEIKHLLGKEHSHKLKDILRSSEVLDIQPIEELDGTESLQCFISSKTRILV